MRRVLSLCLALALPAGGCREAQRPLAVRAQGALALVPVPANTQWDTEIASLQQHLQKTDKQDAESWAKLGRAFVRKAREGNDAGFYAQADDAAGKALSIDPQNTNALQVRQLALLNAHRFVEAQALARQEIKRRPRDEVAWGTLGDSLLELGKYDEALEAYQTMLDIKPDLRSYNRGAWMRWLIGDGEGAVELMKLAIDAGSPRDLESRGYCRVQLGDLYFHLGKYEEARAQYDQALQELPRYAPAHAARGRLNLAVARSDKTIGEGLADLEAALQVQPLTTVRAVYVDGLLLAGREKDAAAELLRLEREGRREDPRALSLFYSTHDKEPALALELAQEELGRRPDIWSLDAMAWALYRAGRLDEAWQAIQGATRLGTRDPRLLYHRGRIAAARNDRKEAIGNLSAALSQSPNWHPSESLDAREVLAGLNP